MKKASAILLAASLSAAVATSAEAQICAGYPTVDRQFTFGARMDFPEDVESIGVEASYNFSGPLGFFGGVNVLSEDDTDESDEVIFGGLAFELPTLGANMLGAGASVCAVGQVAYNDNELGSVLQFPLGLGLGATLGGGPGFNISPYVIPSLVITQFNFDDDVPLFEDETETDFGIFGGALLGFGTFYAGGEVRYLFVDGADPTFGIRAGIRL